MKRSKDESRAHRRERTAIPGVRPHHETTAPAAGALSGAASGAAMGAIAGPPGVIAGVILGGAAGAAAGVAIERGNERQSFHDRQLDDEIGVTSSELGAPNLEHPPAEIGAYSRPSSGGQSADAIEIEPDEGPIPKAD